MGRDPVQRARGIRGGFLTAGHRLQEIDRDEVREFGHRHLGQLPCRPLDVQRGPDPGPRLAEQRQPASGPIAIGDVFHRLGDAEDPAGGILQPEGRYGHHQLLVGVLPEPARLLGEDRRLAGPEDLPQLGLRRLTVRRNEELVGAAPPVLLGRDAAEPCDRPVHPQNAEVRRVHGEADRRAAEEPVQHRTVRLPLDDFLGGRGDDEPLDLGGRSLDGPHSAADFHAVPFAVPDGHDSEPSALADARGHGLLDEPEIGRLDKEVRRLPAQCLLRPVAEKRLGPLAPADDPPSVVQHRGGRTTHRERVFRPFAERLRRNVHPTTLAPDECACQRGGARGPRGEQREAAGSGIEPAAYEEAALRSA